MLFQIDLTGTSPPDVFGTFWSGQEAGEDVRVFAARLVLGVTGELRALDRAIAVSATNWRIERMAVVDRVILRLGVYELLCTPDTPPAVVIDEAVELARTFSADQAVPFVNGVLDAVHRALADRAAPAADAGAADAGAGGTSSS
jgi:N utilization substance protein B